MKRAFVFLLSLLSICMDLFSQRRSLAEAQAIAEIYCPSLIIHTLGSNQDNILFHAPSRTPEKDSFSAYYLFSDTLNSKFFIISGDERMSVVLGEFDAPHSLPDKLPDGLLYLLSLYKERYDSLQHQSYTAVKVSALSAPNVSPIIKTKWGQDSPFNDLCPKYTPSGCVATAMAQIMKQYEYPKKGRGHYAYTSETNRYSCSFDFASTDFEWEIMENEYDSGAFVDSKCAVATLLSACGVSVSMDYAKDGSGAYSVDVPYALSTYFGYNENISCLNRAYYRTNEWLSILYNELKSGRAVLYTGVDSKTGGHAFIIDGCRSSDGKVHVNWGWNGHCDGFFELDALDPDPYRFSTNQNMVYQISPYLTGDAEDIFYAIKMKAPNLMQMDKPAEFDIMDLVCFSNSATYANPNNKFNGKIGLALFDADDRFLEILADKDLGSMNAYGMVDRITLTFTPQQTLLSDGSYKIKPLITNSQSGVMTTIRTQRGETDSYSFFVEKGAINGINSTPPDIEDKDILWKEDFESTALGRTMANNLVVGHGQWDERKVLLSSASVPAAYSGNGYAFLNYRNTDMGGSRNVCQLRTEKIYTGSTASTSLSFAYMKYSKKAENTDLLNILYSEDGDHWNVIKEISVGNISEWLEVSVPLPNVNSLFLAFEGSLGKGSSLFIDHIRVHKASTSEIDQIVDDYKDQDLSYDIMGRKIENHHNRIFLKTNRYRSTTKFLIKP